MKIGSRQRLVVATSAFAVLAAGCSSAADGSATGPGATSAESATCTADRKGGELTMAVGQAAQTLDPVTQNSGSNGGSERAAIFDTLVRYNPSTNKYEPHLAKSLTPNADYTEWTLGLRDGIKFDDGTPMTAEVVKTSVARHTAKGATSNVDSILGLVKEMEVKDPSTLIFRLSKPFGTFPFALAAQGGEITNPAVVDSMGKTFGRKVATNLGVGPYELVKFAPGEEIVMKAKDNYWGGPVCIQTLRFKFIPGGQPTYEAFKLNEAQVAYLSDGRAVDMAEKDKALGLRSGDFGGAAILMNNGVKNTTPPTKDLKIRQAISLAIDPNVMNQRRWDGLGVPSKALNPEGSPLATSVPGPAYDVEKAKALVAEAKAGGWNGQIRLSCTNDATSVETAIAIKALLGAAGITVNASQVTVSELINSIIVENNYDLACWSVGTQASSAYLGLSGYDSQAPGNYAGYANPDMDAALKKLQASASNEDQKAALESIQKVWNDTIPAVIYGFTKSLIAYSPKVHGLTQTSWGTILFNKAYLG